ncbi:hypothetical protein [Fluviispira sanaruensis]|uniref:Uncharacterized protein n=1 Tax=Fluviispira sanaruensis TaxID=2493639 RepID=A0A4P2VQ89_FLUSA|nr:hypothetical protein [Fluviispira sanaruensis]BBH54434.1 hypothetical protein JCM31447_28990 [Fluviispira sanaruensis]
MKNYKIFILVMFLSLIFSSCKKDSNSESVASKLQIINLSGNFGLITMSYKFKRTFELQNFYSEKIIIKNITISNSNFKLESPNPDTTVTSNEIQSCSSELESEKKCLLSVIFQPSNTNFEIGFIEVDYEINGGISSFKFQISGQGKEETETHKLLSQLGNKFIIKFADYNVKGKPIAENKFIKSILEKNHSRKFVYDDFFQDKANKGHEVWDLQLKVPRVIGYVFRSDTRGPSVQFKDCLDEWQNGYKLNDPMTGTEVEYKKQVDKFGNKINCGVEDVGGFWPRTTFPNDLKYINEMLIRYKKMTGEDFDITKQPIDDLPEAPNSKDFKKSNRGYIPTDFGKMTLILNWYLQNQLNLSAHVHENYDFKGFISTSYQAKFVHDWASRTIEGTSTYIMPKGSRWIYVIYTEGGFEMPESNDPDYKITKAPKIKFVKYDNKEVVIAGGVPWEDIMAYTEMDSNKIFFREGFDKMDYKAYKKIYRLLSSFKK